MSILVFDLSWPLHSGKNYELSNTCANVYVYLYMCVYIVCVMYMCNYIYICVYMYNYIYIYA